MRDAWLGWTGDPRAHEVLRTHAVPLAHENPRAHGKALREHEAIRDDEARIGAVDKGDPRTELRGGDIRSSPRFRHILSREVGDDARALQEYAVLPVEGKVSRPCWVFAEDPHANSPKLASAKRGILLAGRHRR